MGYWLNSIKINNVLHNLAIPTEITWNPITSSGSASNLTQQTDSILNQSIIGFVETRFSFSDFYIKWTWTGSDTFQSYIYDNNDVLIGSASGGFNVRQNNPIGFGIYLDDEEQKAQIFYTGRVSSWAFVPSGSNTQRLYEVIINSLPITYNYTPIDFIVGNNKTLKLSKLKATSTNHGDSNVSAELSDFERFTDSTNLYEYAKKMSNGDSIILGYTAPTNYVKLKRIQSQTGQTGNVEILCKLEYYEEDLHHSTMDCEVPYMWFTSADNFKTFYYSLLLDKEHEACRQSLIEISRVPLFDVPTDVRGYNFVENDANLISDTYQSNMYIWLANGYEDGDVENPYSYGGTSGEDGGNGDWDNTSDTIGIPTAPTLNVSDLGFITVFNPTLSQIKSLADYMWSNGFNENTLKKLFANPIDCIIGFSLVPCSPSSGGVAEVVVGNISTGVSMNLVDEQYVDVDCGSIQLKQYWGNYLDYSPYTKLTLVLPFIGSVHLNPDDCMNKTIHIVYRIDILSGGCVAFITCDDNLFYEFTGSCSSQLPITNLDFKNMISSLISIGTTAVGVGSAIAMGGLTAPMVAVGIGNTANNVMNSKPTIEHASSLGSSSGFLSIRKPYLIITRANQCVPKDIEKYHGLPSLITTKLKDVSGYTEVSIIHLDNVSCSEEEKIELDGLLKGGVIV